MAFSWCLLACFLGLTHGFAIDQEGDPPAVFPSREATTAVPALRKEDIGGFENVNPSHVNGEELFEADILLSSEQRRQLLERKAISSTSMRWPNGPNGTPVVPYKFGDIRVANRLAPPGDGCAEVQLNPTSMQWTSPNFGLGNYPNNEPCSLPLSSTSPAWLELQLNTFSLHSTDQVSFLRPTTTNLILKNSQSGVKKLPSMNTIASFYNSATDPGVGFNITINSRTTNCHQLITTGDAGDNGTIAAPTLPNNAWKRKACEFWIRSPTGTKILLTFTNMTMTTTCSANSVIVNEDGNVSYPTGTSQTFCGTAIPAPITSTANAINVLFFSRTDDKIFEAKWSVVAA